MLRALLVSLVVGVCASACANGWPTARHPGPFSSHAATAQSCVPTTSRISRSDCATTDPSSQNSGEDLERTQGLHPNAGSLGTMPSGGGPR
jgi:hypothetical protein